MGRIFALDICIQNKQNEIRVVPVGKGPQTKRVVGERPGKAGERGC